MKNRNVLWLLPIAILVMGAAANLTDFNTNHFRAVVNSIALRTNGVYPGGVTFSGSITSTAFYGSGAGLTGVSATNTAFSSVTATNGITNLSLTANTIIKADANKALASVANAAGRLTNNGTGTFGWDNSAMGISGSDVLTMINTNAVWTNDGTFIYPTSDLPPATPLAYNLIPGPRFFMLENGSILRGTNVTGFFPNSSYLYDFAAVVADSNQLSGVSQNYFFADSLLNNYTAEYQLLVSSSASASSSALILSGYSDGDHESGARFYVNLSSSGYGTNGNVYILLEEYGGDDRLVLKPQQTFPYNDPSYIFDTFHPVTNSTYFDIRTNGTSASKLNQHGVWNANGYQDNSLTPGAIVGVGPSGRLVDTNITQVFTSINETIVFNNITVLTNLTAKNIRVENIYVTNGAVFKEHTWLGPTNQLYVGSTNEYIYTAYTPCAVTNLVELIAGFGNGALLSVTNASDSNITFTVHSPIRIPYGETSRTYTITNSGVFAGSFRSGTHGFLFVPRGFWQP